MSLKSLRSMLAALLTLTGSSLAVAQSDSTAASFPWGLAILVAAAVAVVATVWRSRADARESGDRGAPAADPGWGRQPGHAAEADYGAPSAQSGMGSQVMGALASGLAMGAGAVAAQEIGRRALGEQGQPGAGSGARPDPQSDSPLARDAGIDAVDGTPAGPGFAQDFGAAEGAWDDGDSLDIGDMDGADSWET
jgi:uncharacterized protein